MRSVHCAAIDLGATSGRVIVGSWLDSRLELTEIHRFPNQFRSLAGHDYWDLGYLWSEVQEGLVKAKSRFPNLASVGVDAWAVDHALVNARGQLVHPVYAYRDLRTQKLSYELARDGIEQVYSLTGIPNYPYNSSLQLRATLDSFPLLGEAVSRCLFIPDYFNFLLTGRMENELSVSSHSQLIDVRTRNWSSRALELFGIPRHWFGKAAISPQMLGPITGTISLKGTDAVLVPGHDTACAFAAMPAARDGSDLFLSSGTWSLMGFESERPVLGRAALEARISNERMGDGRYRPLRSCLGLWLLEQTLAAFPSRPKTTKQWNELASSAATLPGPDTLVDIADPLLFNPRNMRAAIDAQLRQRGARPPSDIAGYFKLITASLGGGLADSAGLLARLSGRTFKRIVIVGGGSKNRLLCQATADSCRLPVVSYSLEGSAVGNIASQLVALGEVAGISEFRQKLSRQMKGTEYRPT